MGRSYGTNPAKEYYRGQTWADERLPSAAGSSHGAFAEEAKYHSPTTPGVMSVESALREYCRIPAKRYFLAVESDDGTMHYMCSPNKLHQTDIFNDIGLSALMTGRDGKRHNPDAFGSDSPVYGSAAHRSTYMRGGQAYDSSEGLENWDESYVNQRYNARKRLRGPVSFSRRAQQEFGHINDDAAAVAPPVPQQREIQIGDEKIIWDFCETRFKNLQQAACKTVAKAWVKLVEPKKQSNHPYTNGDENAPDWWPKPWGPAKDDRVRHKEPDHLYKKERVYLLNHILQMIVKPNHKQHPDLQKLNLNVSKLDEATTEALSNFFLDKDNPGNAKKKIYLREIFKVAKARERFLSGEVDADYKVWVNADDKIPDDWQSGDDRVGGTPAQSTDGSMQQRQMRRGSAPTSPLKSTVMQPSFTSHSISGQQGPGSEHSPTMQQGGGGGGGGGGSGHFLNEIPVRPMNDMPPFPAPDMYSSLTGSRRPSLYGLTGEYGSGSSGGSSGGPAMYAQQSWQHTGTGSSSNSGAAAGNASMGGFVFTSQPQALSLPAPFVTQSAGQQTQHPSATPGSAAYMPYVHDGLPKLVESPGTASSLHSPEGQHAGPASHPHHALAMSRHPLPPTPNVLANGAASYPEYDAHDVRHVSGAPPPLRQH